MTAEHERQIFNLVRAELSDELIPSRYKNVLNHRMCGHCHHASLAMYNLLGGKEAGNQPSFAPEITALRTRK